MMEVVWTNVEERIWVYQEKGAGEGKEEKRKARRRRTREGRGTRFIKVVGWWFNRELGKIFEEYMVYDCMNGAKAREVWKIGNEGSAEATPNANSQRRNKPNTLLKALQPEPVFGCSRRTSNLRRPFVSTLRRWVFTKIV